MMVHHLLHSGADVNSKDDSNDTPFHIAITNQDYESVMLLLQYGADIEVRNVNGETILH